MRPSEGLPGSRPTLLKLREGLAAPERSLVNVEERPMKNVERLTKKFGRAVNRGRAAPFFVEVFEAGEPDTSCGWWAGETLDPGTSGN